MRDVNRINDFCNRLAAVWSQVPDWRFGQLVSNILGPDPFYIEDDDTIRKIEGFIGYKHEG